MTKRQKIRRLLLAALILTALATAYYYGGSIARERERAAERTEHDIIKAEALPAETLNVPERPAEADGEPVQGEKTADPSREPDPAEMPAEEQTPPEESLPEPRSTCILSIRCDTLLARLDGLDPSIAALVPADGVLLAAVETPFDEGESVFDVLLRETRARGIAMEFSEAPLYGSAYVEGIGNLYEFDCGELSGWMYRVNGEFPHYGCSHYELQSGDAVEWVYTCDLGADVGNIYSSWQTEDS